MEGNSPSKTAELMAGFRAMEMLRPREDRVCEDPFAEHFLTGAWVSLVKSPFRTRVYQWITHLINPGAHNTVPARVRYIDEHIKTCLQNGLEQMVILGAGYDSRACRLDELKNKVTVFEVDHPATQEQKKKVLETVFETLPENLAFVPYQLGDEGFEQQLFEKGYNENKTSLFILEGLIMYLDPETVKKLFSLISRISCLGSSVVFDFLPAGIEDGSINSRGGKNMNKWALKKGEPFKFGIDKKTLPDFLSSIGFKEISITTAQQCRDIYFKGRSSNRPVSPLFSFANAEVDKS